MNTLDKVDTKVYTKWEYKDKYDHAFDDFVKAKANFYPDK